MCSQVPTNARTHTHTLPTPSSCRHWSHSPAHTRPLGSHSLHTVSGRFLSLSSLRSKHWLMMGFSELHMVCEGRAGRHGGSTGTSQSDSWGGGHSEPRPCALPASSPPSGSGREGHCFYPETLGGERSCEARASPSPRTLWGPSPGLLTGHTVGHLPSVVQKAELPPAQRFPGPLVSQLVPGSDRERTPQTAGLSHAPCLLKRLQERNQASRKQRARRGHLPAQRLPERLREIDGFAQGHTAPGPGTYASALPGRAGWRVTWCCFWLLHGSAQRAGCCPLHVKNGIWEKEEKKKKGIPVEAQQKRI